MNFAVARELSNTPRAEMFRILEEPFIFPRKTLTETFINGEWQDKLRASASAVGFSPAINADMFLKSSPQEFQIEFISLFEVGMGGAPCPLHSGHYMRDRMVTMEETLRYYRFFDFYPDRSADRFPDHINFEMQFMALLATATEHAEITGDDVLSPLLAQRDFATRNLASWLPELSNRIAKHTSVDFFKQVGLLLSEYVIQDLALLQKQVSTIDQA